MTTSQQQYWTTYHSVVGTAIRKLRDSRGHSQSALAQELGVSQSALSKLEKGETAVNVGHLQKIAEFYDFQPHKILKAADDEVGRLRSRGIKVYPDVRPTEPVEQGNGWQQLATAALLSLGVWILLNE